MKLRNLSLEDEEEERKEVMELVARESSSRSWLISECEKLSWDCSSSERVRKNSLSDWSLVS